MESAKKHNITHASLFSGIGGFDLAAEWMGWENVLHCEVNSFCTKLLKYYWPKAISYHDITQTDFTIHRGSITVLSGGFPCQPFSLAGKRKGTADSRHLWPQMLRAIREIRPRWVVGENVYGLVNWDRGMVFQQVQADLEAEGYEVQAYILPAAGAGAPHRRDRVFVIAHCSRYGCRRYNQLKERHKPVKWWPPFGIINAHDGLRYAANTNGGGLRRESNRVGESKFFGKNEPENYWAKFPTQPPVCGRNDGLSTGLDGITFSKWRNESIKAYGNAVVPQVVLQIFQAIQQYENQ